MNTPNEQALSVGEIFRQTRERLNLSLEDVAKEISLRPSLLQQLENNEFIHKSTPSTFVRGYVRSYAKFLRLPDSVWENITFAETEKNDLGKNARSTRAVNQYSSHSRWVGRLTALVLIIVIGMTGLWWWQNYQQNNQERDNLVQNYVETTDTMPVEENKTQSTLIEKNAVQTSVELQPLPDISNTTSPDSNNGNVLPQGSENNVESSANTTAVTETVQSLTNKNVSQTETQTTLENENASPALPVTKGDLIVEVINNSSWISVKDKKRRVLAQKEYKQGETLTFNGDEFSLIVGAPGNVRITYKGENYPLKVDGRVAKFKLSQP